MRKMREGERLAARSCAKTHCRHGHPYVPHNTMMRLNRKTGYYRRECRCCHRVREMIRYWANKRRDYQYETNRRYAHRMRAPTLAEIEKMVAKSMRLK